MFCLKCKKYTTMIKTIKELEENYPELIEGFNDMDRDELLNQIKLEVIDALNMESRVAKFMAECTNNMSKTTYTIEAIDDLIKEQKRLDIQDFCDDLIEMSPETAMHHLVESSTKDE